MPRPRRTASWMAALALAALLGAPAVAIAAPEGTLTFAMHFAPVPRWLDPAEGESTITPFFILYALHDALLKPMAGFYMSPYEDLTLRRQ